MKLKDENLINNENNKTQKLEKELKENKEKQKIIHDNLLNENITLEKEINNLKEQLNIEKEKNEEKNIINKVNNNSDKKYKNTLDEMIKILEEEKNDFKKKRKRLDKTPTHIPKKSYLSNYY